MHGQIDTGLVAMTAAMPGWMSVEDAREAKFFSRHALAKTAITAMTNFDYGNRREPENTEDDEGFV